MEKEFHIIVKGSTLSCCLYLVYILDLPEIFHEEKHRPLDERICSEPTAKTFIDNVYIKTNNRTDKTFERTVQKVMEKVEKYTRANKLQLNSDKTQVMLLTGKQKEKEEFSITLRGK